MAIKIINASNTEREEAKRVGQHLVTGRYYNSDKTVEKFINTHAITDELINTNPTAVLNDYTVTGFKLFFHFSAQHGLLADEIYENSALKYLKDIGDLRRYNLLKLFRKGLAEVNSEHPWIFHTIEGLREIYTNPWDAVSFFNHSSKLIINTYETVDYKIATLNRLWREIYWDKTRGVMVLPENLREFSMSIYLLDMRVFDTKFKFLRTWETEAISDIQHQLFDIGCCQFLNESGGQFFDAVTNMSVQENMNSFVLGFDTADISILSPSLLGDADLSSKYMGEKVVKEDSSQVNDITQASISNDATKVTDFSVKNYINKIKTNFLNNVDQYGRNQAAYYTHQESKLLGISSDLTNLISNIKGGATDIHELMQGNVQGAGLVNLAKELGDTSFGSITNRSTLSGNEPSLSLDTKKIQ